MTHHSLLFVCGVTGILLLTSLTVAAQQTTPVPSPTSAPETTEPKDSEAKPNKPSTPDVKSKRSYAPKITISPEITWAVSPIGPSGFVDYIGAINEYSSRGVTPENNAVVLLYQATGPAPEGQPQPDIFFKKLGVTTPAAEGPYFQDFVQWSNQTKGKRAAGGALQSLKEREETCWKRPWTASEFPDVAAWLDSMQKPLALVTAATQRAEYYSPLIPPDGDEGGLIGVLLPGTQRSRALGRTIQARAMRFLGENEPQKCWDDLLTVHRLGRLVGRGPTAIEGLVGISIETTVIEAEGRFIADTRPSAKLVEGYLKQLSELPVRCKLVEKLDRSERAMFLDCCLMLARRKMTFNDLAGSGPNQNDFFKNVLETHLIRSVDWDAVLKSGNQEFDSMVRALRLPAYPDRVTEATKVDFHLRSLRTEISPAVVIAAMSDRTAGTKLISNVLISLLYPAFSVFDRADSRATQRFINIQVTLALMAYRHDHGAYPETLGALAPKYLREVPLDLFSTQPLHYKRILEGFQLYSVGDNMHDDQGQSYDAGPDKDDIVVTIPIPK